MSRRQKCRHVISTAHCGPLAIGARTMVISAARPGWKRSAPDTPPEDKLKREPPAEVPPRHQHGPLRPACHWSEDDGDRVHHRDTCDVSRNRRHSCRSASPVATRSSASDGAAAAGLGEPTAGSSTHRRLNQRFRVGSLIAAAEAASLTPRFRCGVALPRKPQCPRADTGRGHQP